RRGPECAAVGAGCGASGSEPGAPSPAPSTPAGSPDAVTTLLSTCSADAQRWQAVPVDGVTGAAKGSGPATVVLLNDSGNSVCGWLPLADALVERQLQVVISRTGRPPPTTSPRRCATPLPSRIVRGAGTITP